MFSKSKVKKVDFVTLSKFYGKYKEALQLELINSPAGLSRHICEPALNRPGLAIAGFYSYFANKRIQVFGSAELAYLQKLPEGMRKSRIQRMFRCEVPGIVFSRDKIPPREIVELADEAGVCVFRTSLVTMKFVNSATIILENEFAESVTLHGCMVDVRGVGVLIRGKSGVGKSETALGLIERGAALVADDMVYVRNVGGELVASAPEMSRGFMEVRGLGIVNIFLRTDTLRLAVSSLAAIVLSGFLLHHTSRILRHAGQMSPVTGALRLYLDFYNLFLALLRLLGRRS